MAHEITTSRGTTVTLADPNELGDRLIRLSNPDAPEQFQDVEAGRAIDGGFQMPFIGTAAAMSPEVLRAIADLIDTKES